MKKTESNVLSEKDWDLVRRIFDRCQSLPIAKRKAFVEMATRALPHLRAEVESLLASSEEPLPGLEKPIAAPLLEFSQARNGPPTSSAPVAPLPSRLGAYKVHRKLGEGGMAEVFLASGPDGRLLAVKRLYPRFVHEQGFRQLFEWEAKICRLLRHKGIVGIHELVRIDGQYVITMEYVAGRNLMQILSRAHSARAVLPGALALHLVSQLCAALDYTHRRCDETTGEPLNIVHRDISPKNILISFAGDVKLADFGIAKARGRPAFTDVGAIRGTLNYLAPEVLVGERDHRSDLFSLALVLFELLTGEALYPLREVGATLKLIRECRLPAEKLETAELSAELKSCLGKGLEKEPMRRYENAAAFLQDLRGLLKRESEAALSRTLGHYVSTLFAREKKEEEAPS